ncbi:MAG: hypothetical protein M3Z14_07285 [Candidatus Eremiobacteraeota bacterium]|nr:hypothetical protein [Candidatus Eremiobacteraeota bacterium]
MLQIFRKNFLLKLLSLLLAVMGWSYFRFASNPVIAARFDQQLSVPITVIRLPLGYFARFTEKQAVVSVARPRRGGPAIKPDDVKAVLDLDGRTAGVYNIAVQLVAPNDVTIQSLSPASVTLTVEKVEQKHFALALHYVGDQRFNIVVNSVRTTPDQAVVRGSSTDLARVTAVRIDVPFAAQPSALDAMERPQAVDSLGQDVPNVQVSPNLVRVNAHFVNAKNGALR